MQHEQTERMTAHDPVEKEMATERKEERMRQAELDKQEARLHNAAANQGGHTGYNTTGHTGSYNTGLGTGGTGITDTYSRETGTYGHPTSGQQMSAMPGHGTGQPTGGYVVDDVDVVRNRDTQQYGGNDNAHGYGGTTRSGTRYT